MVYVHLELKNLGNGLPHVTSSIGGFRSGVASDMDIQRWLLPGWSYLLLIV